MGRSVTCVVTMLVCVSAVVVPSLCAAAEDEQDRQSKEQFDTEITVQVKLNYLLYLPAGYSGGEKSWPLLLFLHGAGERGNNLDDVTKHGPPKLIAASQDFPFIVVSPQAGQRGWDAATLNALLDDLMAKHRVDKDRVYVTGLSMGGYGTWSLAAAYPDRFAAIAPICGGGNPTDAKKLKNLPIWVFHGAQDRVVPLSRSEAMVSALKEAGSVNVKFTIYPEAGHDSWTETYDNPELYEWLLKHSCGENN